MKKTVVLFFLFSFAVFNIFSFGYIDESLTEKEMMKLEKEIRQNDNVKDVRVRKFGEYAKYCDVEIYLKNGGYICILLIIILSQNI